jgi:hypothetical protein
VDRPDRSVVLIGGGVLAVVLVAVVVIVALGTPEPETFPPDSPEYALQQYLDAAHSGDEERARSFLSRRALAQIPADAPGRTPYCPPLDGRRITVDDVERSGDRATVTVEITELSGSGLDFDRYSWEYTVRMVLEDGAWKLDDPYVCV